MQNNFATLDFDHWKMVCKDKKVPWCFERSRDCHPHLLGALHGPSRSVVAWCGPSPQEFNFRCWKLNMQQSHISKKTSLSLPISTWVSECHLQEQEHPKSSWRKALQKASKFCISSCFLVRNWNWKQSQKGFYWAFLLSNLGYFWEMKHTAERCALRASNLMYSHNYSQSTNTTLLILWLLVLLILLTCSCSYSCSC